MGCVSEGRRETRVEAVGSGTGVQGVAEGGRGGREKGRVEEKSELHSIHIVE